MVHELQKDMHDAFGESPRPVTLLFALTELKMLAGHFGIDSILKQPPDLILTVRDAARCQIGLTGAPGTIRVIDEKTVYLRMPTTFIEAEPCLLTLRNLMYQAWEREKRGEPAPAVQPAPIVAKAHAKVGSAPQAKKPEPAPPRGSADYEKLVTLRDQGILTDEEFQAALRRLAGSSKR